MTSLRETLSNIKKIEIDPDGKIQAHLDDLTKPQGSLGLLEELAKKCISIAGTLNPKLNNKVAFVMAGDHGIVAEGVSAFPQEVTGQMIANFLSGGAAINVIANYYNSRVVVVDCGTAAQTAPTPGLKIKKVGPGTKNFAKGPAMTREEAEKSIEAGISAFEEELNTSGIDIASVGDMGIGNTTPSSAIISCITGEPAESVTGRGTGVDNEGLRRKITAITNGLETNRPDRNDPIDVLAKVGGFEIGGIAGVCLAGAKHRIPVVFDGLIATSGALLACELVPAAKEYIFASHCSVEPGHKIALGHMGQKGVIDLGMRLGEGTGAAIVMGLIELAVKISNEMATFSGAKVSQKHI